MERASRLAGHLRTADAGGGLAQLVDSEVYVVSAVRTPLGGLGGSLSRVAATELGAVAVREAVSRAGVAPGDVGEAFLGCVLQANLGQAPARQAALAAGLPPSVPCTTLNKVCASGLKAVACADQAIRGGACGVAVAGGFESMSRVPYYAESARFGARMGHARLVDGMVHDGLWDPYNGFLMGRAAEMCARRHGITRREQDDYAAESYRRANAAHASGAFAREIVAVPAPPGRRGAKPQPPAETDDECAKFDERKLRALRPAFADPERPGTGTVTAGNASVISDGAAALVLASGREVRRLGLAPRVIARVAAHADAARAPVEFTEAPADAVRLAAARAGVDVADIDLFEINEAFAVVAIANCRLLGVAEDRVNVLGGAVSLGHPLGCSGARILVTLLTALELRDKRYGCAAICNGGGGASALIVERVRLG